ncbi:MAG: hypothetical protein OES79_08190, partial [Planctomycetota bacterium]|nr:hypothetical protein [Planctomycetota bacterium]
ALGDHLTVCFASAEVLWAHKRRRSSIPDEHKHVLLESLEMVDHVVMGTATRIGLDFEDHFLRLQPDILAVTVDDQYEHLKRDLCRRVGTAYHVLSKTPPTVSPVTTTDLVRYIRAPIEAPVRVDFAGGWLDVPRLARPGAFVVNCTVSPCVSLREWPYQRNAGLGGSGAIAMLEGRDGVEQELRMGVGWQDPAVIAETGLCVWESGPRPVLEFKRNGRMLAGRMALWWTGSPHDTPALIDHRRDYDAIETAGRLARDAVIKEDFEMLAEAVSQSYAAQLDEGMQPLPDQADALGYKYCGSGWGGYAVYLFKTSQQRDVFAKSPGALVAEPYTRHAGPTRKRSTGELANRTRAAPSANAAAQGAQLPSS